MDEKEIQEMMSKDNAERVMQECYAMWGIW